MGDISLRGHGIEMRKNFAKGGKVKKDKSFPDLNKDGKVTFKDVLMGRGIVKKAKGGKVKVGKVMREFKKGKLHSGSKKGPVVKSRKQAIAIALSEAGMSKKKK
jgi:hypothetical protein